MSRKPVAQDPGCPCGSGQHYSACCGRFIDSEECAPTAEQLMRSRYTAFARGEADYLLATWHPATRPSRVRLDPAQRWIGLRILGSEQGGPEDDTGTVEFVARYKEAGRGHRLHEVSHFERIGGRWFYREGDYQ
ncbi:YchJ family protein [Parahaliea maris]|uniref:UPF0225 protein FV139_00010 n=1 Tax=Parahaliea maris TaxID=2716870 RepID=A0A5C9A4X9_9GAMM|nr:YchJ family protein [Parahaliea maris]TXS95935.1 YchJ family protein [Parahaliea maris]